MGGSTGVSGESPSRKLELTSEAYEGVGGAGSKHGGAGEARYAGRVDAFGAARALKPYLELS